MIESAFRSLVVDNVEVAALVSARMYPQLAPPTAARPFLVYNRIDGVPGHQMIGQSEFAQARMQVDCYADDYSEVKLLADKVRLAINCHRGDVGSGSDLVEDVKIRLVNQLDGIGSPQAGKGRAVHRVTADYEVTYKSELPDL